MFKKKYNCRACGAEIKLTDKICVKCGAENVIRKEKIKNLEAAERQVEQFKSLSSASIISSKGRRAKQHKKQQEAWNEFQYKRSINIKRKKTKLIIGNSHEGKLEWIKTEYYDFHRNLQEIAEDLGESMITVRNYLDEIESQDKSKNEKKSHQEDSID